MFTTMQIAIGVLTGASIVFWMGVWYVRKYMLPKRAVLVDTMMMSSTLQGLCKLAVGGGEIDVCTVIAVTNGSGNPAIGKTMRTMAFNSARPIMPQGQGLEMDTDYVVTVVEAMSGRKEYVVENMKWGLLRAVCEEQNLKSIAIRVLHSTDDILFYVIFGSHTERSLVRALHEMAETEANLKRAIKSVL